jgi:hypothetical protein
MNLFGNKEMKREIVVLNERIIDLAARTRLIESLCIALLQQKKQAEIDQIAKYMSRLIVNVSKAEDPIFENATPEEKQKVRDRSSLWLQSFLRTAIEPDTSQSN